MQENSSCPPQQNCHQPERTRISYFAALARTAGAVSLKGNPMTMIDAKALDRKSGGAKWRDLQCALRLSQILPGKRPRMNR
jgi:hypothetical protein